MSEWIILKGPEGQRKVEAGKPYRRKPGEIIIGNESDFQVAQFVEVGPAEKLLNEIELELRDDGHGLGSWVKYFAKPVARLLGKESCLQCEARKTTLNALTKLTEKHGRPAAKKIVKDLMIRSFKVPPEIVLKELREALK